MQVCKLFSVIQLGCENLKGLLENKRHQKGKEKQVSRQVRDKIVENFEAELSY